VPIKAVGIIEHRGNHKREEKRTRMVLKLSQL